MKYFFQLLLFLAIGFPLTCFPLEINEGDEYVYMAGEYGLTKAVIERYSGGKNAKADVTVAAQTLFGSCNYLPKGTIWVNASALMTCSQAKKYLIETKGKTGYKWNCFCG